MHTVVVAFEMLGQIMNLSMAVMAWGDTIIRSGFDNLSKFQFAVFPACLRIAGLQKPASPATTEIIGSIGLHVDKIFLSHHAFDDKTKILGNGIPKGFSDQLARILNRKFYFQVLVPIGTDLEFTLPNPLGIVLDNTSGFKVVWNIEFFQSDPDCEKFMPSLGVEPNLAAEIIHGFGLYPHNIFPVFKIRTEQTIVFRSPSLWSHKSSQPHRVKDFP
jgi:hypothetical protein